jgi:hypothetical protein
MVVHVDDSLPPRTPLSQFGGRRQHLSRGGTVPTIVPATRQNSVIRANDSQLARSLK